jgi:cohesin complex subunit SA-1/2
LLYHGNLFSLYGFCFPFSSMHACNMLIWYFSTPPRVYRQVASLVGLQLVTSFISVAKTLCAQRETTQRQLNAEKKKQSDGPLVESLNNRLTLTHEHITYLEEFMRKIFSG